MDELYSIVVKYLYVGLIALALLIYALYCYYIKRKLAFKYPELTIEKRKFMYYTVEKHSERIHDFLTKKLKIKGVTKEIRKIRWGDNINTIHIVYSSPEFKTDVIVVLSSDKQDTFEYNGLNHELGMESRNKLHSVFNIMNL